MESYKNGHSQFLKPQELRERTEYMYINTIQCSIMEHDIRIAFGDQGPGKTSETVEPTAGIILHPVLAKRFLGVLLDTINKYEASFGPIQMVRVDAPKG